MLFHPNTPPDVLEYLKDLHNELNNVASVRSFVEALHKIGPGVAAWEKYNAEQTIIIHPGENGYERARWEWIDNTFPKSFRSQRHFTSTMNLPPG